MIRLLSALILIVQVGCAPGQGTEPTITFLTRHGCVNTDTMRARLDEALTALQQPIAYAVVDADTLPTTDPRVGYGTPTVLVEGRDLFGQPVPPGSSFTPT